MLVSRGRCSACVCVGGGGAGLSGNGIRTVGNVRGSAFHRLPRRSGTAGLGRRRPPSYQPGLHVRYAAPLSTAQRSSRAQSWLFRSRNPVEVDSARMNRVGGGLGPRQKSRPPGLKGRAGDRERRALSAVAPPTPRPLARAVRLLGSGLVREGHCLTHPAVAISRCNHRDGGSGGFHCISV